MVWKFKEFELDLKENVKRYDTEQVATLCEQLIEYLHQATQVYPQQDAESILSTLRRKRYFGLMQKVAAKFLQSGLTSGKISSLYAQAMIDQGNLLVTEAYLLQQLNEPHILNADRFELQGLLGRVYKDIYINARNRGSRLVDQYLTKAIDRYLQIYNEDKKNIWHGVNACALLCRADTDKVSLADINIATPKELSDTIATELNGAVEAKYNNDPESVYYWELATAAEACVALQQEDKALTWLRQYILDEKVDAFELASTLRQFEDVWYRCIDRSSEFYLKLMTILKTELLQKKQGSEVRLSNAEFDSIVADTESRDGLEKLLGTARFVSIKWFSAGLENAKVVARIESKTGEFIGTGFLVKGSDLSPNYSDELVLLTNAHVIANTDHAASMVARFDQLGGIEVEFENLEWSSRPEELDASILRLKNPPANVVPIEIARRTPLVDNTQRIYIIGHPGGRNMSFSIQDNILLASGNNRIQYRAPTEPGSSGSPVFNSSWQLVALHHSGSKHLPRIDGQPGTIAANEGILLESIKQKLV